MTQEQVEFFRRAIAAFLPDWKTFELRVIAERGRANDWVLNSLRAILGSALSGRGRDDLPRIPELLVVHEYCDVGELDGLLESLLGAELSFSGEVIDLKRPNTSPANPSFYFRRRDRHFAMTQFAIDSAAFVLEGSDTITSRLAQDEFRTVDASLRAAAPPWDGLADLRRNFMGIQGEQAVRTDYSSLEVVAPLGVNLSSSSRLELNEVNAFVATGDGAQVDRISLSVIAGLSDGRVARIRESFPGTSRSDKRELLAKIKIPGAPSKVTLLLSYRGLEADRLEFFGQPATAAGPRLAVLKEIAGDIDALALGLENARNKGRELEGWVALLFHLLGFSSGHYGVTHWEAPDVIAFAESGAWFLVVECTEREPDVGGKLAKLATRTKELGRATGTQAYPVLVTALERSLLNRTDLEKASKESIAIVSANEFRELIQLTLERADPARVRTALERLIPVEGGMGRPYWPR